jgi:aryl-alcohol dehydrogenase-like predicted oxidoreductase
METIMEMRKLGTSDLSVPVVGLGCNNFGGRIDLEATRKVIDTAIDLGITHFDTADVYGGGGKSEELIGQLLGDRRNKVILATKFGKMADGVPGTRGTRAYVLKCAEASLKRLRTDHIDLYYMHESDPQTPIAETLQALDDLKKAGKIRHAAASNFSPAQLEEAVATAKRLGVEGFVATQEEYSLSERGIEKEMLGTIEKTGLGLVPYFPLGGGALTGKYRKDQPLPAGSRHSGGSDRFLAPYWDMIEKLHDFAEARGHTILELAMSWLAARPNVASIIAGATKPHQLEANAKSTGWKLSAADLAEIDRIAKPGA